MRLILFESIFSRLILNIKFTNTKNRMIPNTMKSLATNQRK